MDMGVLPVSVVTDGKSRRERSLGAAFLIERKPSLRSMVLESRKVFSLSGQVLHDVRDRADRELLSRRIGSYLSGKRRGKLHFPHRLPESVQALTYLSKRELRLAAYWVNPDMSCRWTTDSSTSAFMHRVAPGMIWTRTGDSPIPTFQAVVKRLPGKAAPRVTRKAWPSAPDLFEILEQSRQGKVSLIQDRIPLTVDNCLTRKAVANDIRLASKIVRRQIVGIRIHMEVPRKFLGYFRRRHGFLILSCRHNLPAGLVRFLIACWIRTPTSLWLVEYCPFRLYLRRKRYSDFIRVPASTDAVIDPVSPERLGKPNQEISSSELDIFWPPMSKKAQLALLWKLDIFGHFPPRSSTKMGTPFAVRYY